MSDKELGKLADRELKKGNKDLAIVLYTYLGSRMVGMGSEFAKYSKLFAKEGVKQIEMLNNRSNN